MAAEIEGKKLRRAFTGEGPKDPPFRACFRSLSSRRESLFPGCKNSLSKPRPLILQKAPKKGKEHNLVGTQFPPRGFIAKGPGPNSNQSPLLVQAGAQTSRAGKKPWQFTGDRPWSFQPGLPLKGKLPELTRLTLAIQNWPRA